MPWLYYVIVFWLFLKIYLFIWTAVTKRERELLSTGSFPKWLQQLELDQAKAGSQEFHLGVRGSSTGPSLLFSDIGRKLLQKWSIWNFKSCPYGMPGRHPPAAAIKLKQQQKQHLQNRTPQKHKTKSYTNKPLDSMVDRLMFSHGK